MLLLYVVVYVDAVDAMLMMLWWIPAAPVDGQICFLHRKPFAEIFSLNERISLYYIGWGMDFSLLSYIFMCSLLPTVTGINRVTPACQTDFHSSLAGALAPLAQHTVMKKIFIFLYFLYLFVSTQDEVLFWRSTPKCKSFWVEHCSKERHRLWHWMHSYSIELALWFGSVFLCCTGFAPQQSII